ncbi:MAG: TetR/AcrR family transcriptional regulator [Propionibacteriaceae bacterium]|nr:TetR/AcrR family transcriptional regulator [Propionibacteriaceae bacterium]
MPKIAAPTVAQHRAMVQRRLVDAAEEIMRSGEPEKLTAGAVTAAAGIARNSIYRYVDSVDDLRGMVLARHLPAWIDAVSRELKEVDDPAERIVVWVRANLQQAARTGHGWLMGLSRSITPSPATARVMDGAHTVMRDAVAHAWGELVTDPQRLRAAAGLTRGLLEAGFRQLDSGMPVDVVVEVGEKAARGLVAGIVGQRA